MRCQQMMDTRCEEEGKHEYGFGFLVHKDVVGAVLGCQQVFS